MYEKNVTVFLSVADVCLHHLMATSYTMPTSDMIMRHVTKMSQTGSMTIRGNINDLTRSEFSRVEKRRMRANTIFLLC